MSTSSLGVSTSLGVSSPGIGSGLDVNGIISKLMAVESQPLALLNAKEASYQAQLTGYGTLSGALSSFQSSLFPLTNLSTFQSLSATPFDPTIFSASASPGATLGNYAVTVNALAQSQSLTATGQTSSTAAIGTGSSTTLSFSFGTISGGTLANGIYTGATFTQDPTQATKTVTINSTNNSLQGIRDAINAANIGVTASIVNDGSASPYRLQLTSTSGLSHSMQISVTGDATLSGLLSYNPAGTQNLNQSLAAQNASLNVNGLAITSASNTVSSAIPNTTLNLLKTGTTGMSIANNTSGIQSAVQSFVTAYNSLNSTFANLMSYNPSTKQAGLLNGDLTTMTVQNRLRSLLTQAIPGLSNISITNLSQLGISVSQNDGSLSLNTATLQNAIATNPSDIAGLFASVGKATDSLVSYVSSGTNTQPGTYAVNVTQLATQGAATGNANVSGGATITTGSNVVTNASNAATGLVSDLGTTSISFTASVNGGAANAINVTGLTTGANFNAAVNAAAIVKAVNASAANAAGLVAAQDSSGHLYFSTSTGQSVTFAGFTGGTFASMAGLGTGLSNTIAAAPAIATTNTNSDTFTINGVTLSPLTATGTAATDATNLKNAINANASLTSMGISAALSATSNSVVLTASDARALTLSMTSSGTDTLASWGFASGTVTSAAVSKYNNTMNLTLNGVSSTVTLAAGTYNSSQLTALVQAAINGNSAFSGAGSSVAVTVNGSGNMVITSATYGSSTNVSMTGGGTGVALMGTGSTATAGVDVAGTINGVTATGSGQYLTGASGTAVDSLKLRINGGSLGSRGTVSFSQGYATTLNNAVTSFVAPNSIISAATNGINSSITAINNQITAMNQYLAQVQKNYQAQFTALDVLMGQLNSTTNYLTQQLTQMSYTYKNYG